MNVSLTPAQERFVRSQVKTGRYRSASEVLRDGLRLLEEHEHRRLLEKWIYQGLTSREQAQLPESFKKLAREHFKQLVDQARSDIQNGHMVDGRSAVERLRSDLLKRRS